MSADKDDGYRVRRWLFNVYPGGGTIACVTKNEKSLLVVLTAEELDALSATVAEMAARARRLQAEMPDTIRVNVRIGPKGGES